MDTIDNKNNRFARGIVGTVLVILLLLTVICATLLAIRLINYISRDDKEVLLQSNLNTELDLFSVQYENESGELVVFGSKEQNVVAPGTAVDYTIRLRNKDKVAVDYYLIPDVSYTSEHKIPIVVRMLDEEGKYIIGDAKNWVKIEEITALSEMKTLTKGESTEYVFQWKWEFESGDDEYDTYIGSIANEQSIGISVKFDLHTEANTEIDINGGVVNSGLGDIIVVALLLVLLIIAVTLQIIYIVKKRKLGNV